MMRRYRGSLALLALGLALVPAPAHAEEGTQVTLTIIPQEKDGKPIASLFRSRVDLLDLNRSVIVASLWRDGIVLRFIGPDLLLKLEYDESGAPLLGVFGVTMERQ